MSSRLSHLSDQDLLASLPIGRAAERTATVHVIVLLAEVDRRRLYLGEACSSLYTFCVQRLGYSENEAQARIQVARLYQHLPQVLAKLENGSIHLTGLFLLSPHLTERNAASLLAEARGKSRREIEAILARWFPRTDVLPSITPLPSHVNDISVTIPEHDTLPAAAGGVSQTGLTLTTQPRIEPLSASSYRVEFTAGATLRDKIEQASNLLGHAVPSGDLAQLFERALDALLDRETKRRIGAGKPHARRTLRHGSRHVPIGVARAVRERDGAQCTFVDPGGRRCTERRFLTLEHREPFARGGPASIENLCLLCSSHNALRAREEFGEAHIAAKQREAQAHDKTLSALVRMGFDKRRARAALDALRSDGTPAEIEPLLRGALARLVS